MLRARTLLPACCILAVLGVVLWREAANETKIAESARLHAAACRIELEFETASAADRAGALPQAAVDRAQACFAEGD